MNVPKLRFPSFTEEWERKSLGKISKINPSNQSLPERFIYIDLESVSNGELSKEEVVLKSEAPSRAQRILEKEDIIFQTVRPYQKNNLFFNKNGVYVASTGYAQIRTKETSRFLYQYLHFQNFVDKVIERCTGTSYPAINSTDLSNIQISFPKLSEQNKIATFLTSVDEQLTQLKKKKTLLEQYKKGVVQKIFSQELRFKDENGKEFPKWEIKRLCEVSEKIMYGMNAAAIAYNGENKYLRITDIDENSRKYFPSPLTSPAGKIDEKFKLKEGDIVFARTGASVGKSYLYNKSDGNLFFAGFLIKFSIINCNAYFIFIQTLKESYHKWVQLMSMRSGQPGINAEEYKTLLFSVPCITEQTKIANFLSALDDKINHCKMQIEKTELWKKGLLQKMFV